MHTRKCGAWCAATLLVLATVAPAAAATPAEFLANFERSARAAEAGFAGFSAQRGAVFFKSTHGQEWSCASCHTENPAATGRHAKTGKAITPLAPAANAQRFTDAAKVDKWFRRNCNDVLGRECTPREQGDVLAYLNTVRP
jgi:hypothetical protein